MIMNIHRCSKVPSRFSKALGVREKLGPVHFSSYRTLGAVSLPITGLQMFINLQGWDIHFTSRAGICIFTCDHGMFIRHLRFIFLLLAIFTICPKLIGKGEKMLRGSRLVEGGYPTLHKY